MVGGVAGAATDPSLEAIEPYVVACAPCWASFRWASRRDEQRGRASAPEFHANDNKLRVRLARSKARAAWPRRPARECPAVSDIGHRAGMPDAMTGSPFCSDSGFGGNVGPVESMSPTGRDRGGSNSRVAGNRRKSGSGRRESLLTFQ